MPKLTRPELYEQLKREIESTDNERLHSYLAHLKKFNEFMDKLHERNADGERQPVTDEHSSKVKELKLSLLESYWPIRDELWKDQAIVPEQRKQILADMKDMQERVGTVATRVGKGNTEYVDGTIEDVLGKTPWGIPATRDRAAQLHKLLGDNTSIFRGSSDNYRAVEKALEAIKKSGQEPTREQLLAVKEAAERYKFEKEETIRDREKPMNEYEESRINAVKEVLIYANEGLGLSAADNQREAMNAQLAKGDSVQDGVNQIVQHYQPKPELHQASLEGKAYTQEQFNKLETLDVKGMKLAGEPISDREFATVSIMAMMTKDVGGKYVTVGAGPVEVAEADRDPIFAAANSSAYVMDLGNKGGARANCGLTFGVNNEARKVAHNAIKAYQEGDKAPLAKLIGEGVKNTVALSSHFSTNDKTVSMTRDQRLLDQFVFGAVDMVERDPQLMELASKQGLTKETLKKVEGLRRMENVQRMATTAKEKLKQGNLTKTEKEVCVTAVLRWKAMDTASRTAVKERESADTPELAKAAQADERQRGIEDERFEIRERYQEVVAAGGKIPEADQNRLNELEVQKGVTMQQSMGWNLANINVPAPIAQLGGKGALAQMKQQVNGIIPDKSGLMKLDGEKLLETLDDPKLLAPDAAAKQKYANIYNPPAQQRNAPQKQQGGPALTM